MIHAAGGSPLDGCESRAGAVVGGLIDIWDLCMSQVESGCISSEPSHRLCPVVVVVVVEVVEAISSSLGQLVSDSEPECRVVGGNGGLAFGVVGRWLDGCRDPVPEEEAPPEV